MDPNTRIPVAILTIQELQELLERNASLILALMPHQTMALSSGRRRPISSRFSPYEENDYRYGRRYNFRQEMNQNLQQNQNNDVIVINDNDNDNIVIDVDNYNGEAEYENTLFEEYQYYSVNNTRISQQEVKRIMKNYPTETMQEEHPQFNEVCSICQEKFSESSKKFVKTKCEPVHHFFHPRCFRKNLKMRQTCAICRATV